MEKTCDNCDDKHMRFQCNHVTENEVCTGWIADDKTLRNEVKELKRKLEELKNTIINHERAYDHLSLEYKKLDDSFGELQKDCEELKRKLEICKKSLTFYFTSCPISREKFYCGDKVSDLAARQALRELGEFYE